MSIKKVNIRTLQTSKENAERFAVTTAYDATLAQTASEAGIEVLLVGDSLGNVVQGQDSTVPVTLEHMVYHTQCVARGNTRSLVIGDMPFMTYQDPFSAAENAAELMRAGANMVKMEGGAWLADTIAHLNHQGIPVCAHLGLLPQSYHLLGGYRIQGKTEEDAARMLADAKELEEAGAQLLVVEMIPEALAKKITEELSIPVIGIGAGGGTDAQVLVIYDLLGLSGYIPSFSKNFMEAAGGVKEALQAYGEAIRSGQFPDSDHTLI